MVKKYKFLESAENLCEEDIAEIKKWLKYNNINVSIDNYGCTLLEAAVMNGSIEVIDFLIKNGANQYLCTSDEWLSLVELAALSGQLNVIKYFLNNNFNREVFLKDGSLISAAINNYSDIVKYLINQGKDINQSDTSSGMSALNLAAQMGNVECVKLLCELGANIDYKSKYGTPLFCAASEGYIQIVKILVDYRADVNYITNDGSTPYEISKYNGYNEISKYLLQHGADSNFAFIRRCGKIPVPRYMYRNKEDAYKRAKCAGKSEEPICHENEKKCENIRYKNITKENDIKVYRWMENHNIPMPSDDDKLTWLEYAIMNDSLEMVKFLVVNGYNLYTSSSYEWSTLIEFASMYGRLNIIKYLIENNYNKGIFLNDNSLIFAASNNFTDIIRYLIEKGKNIEHFFIQKRDDDFCVKHGYTALREAAQVNSIESVKLLCELGANVNVEGEDTPLYSAAAEGNFEIVKILFAHGANANYTSRFGVTPYQIADCYHNKDIVDYFSKHCEGVSNGNCN